ncbi:fibronectin type III domain-containing protein [Candidatus Omnitrophota bacterium]
MKRVYAIIALCSILCGCATPTPIKKFISPSQAIYDRANAYFEEKDYDSAIATYEKFIKDHPRHDLTPGAHLGIAWSYYLKGDYEASMKAQKSIRTKDTTLKAWLDKLVSNCKSKLASTASTSAAPSLFDIPLFTNQKILKVEGTIPQNSGLSINEISVIAKDGLFSQEIPLEDGSNLIKIKITDKDGNIETKESEVTLDTTIPRIEVTDAELDDFGYVTISGITEAGSVVIANDDELFVSPKGEFEGEVKLSRNLKIELISEDRAGNIGKMVFSDTDYPDRPTGLSLVSAYGDSADLEWNENSEKDMKGYNIYYSLAGGFSDQKHNTELITGTRHTIGNLESGNTYAIYIRAVDKMGNESDPSRETVMAVMP